MTTERELWEAEVEARLGEVEARSMVALRALRDAGLLATCPICEGKRVVPGEDGEGSCPCEECDARGIVDNAHARAIANDIATALGDSRSR